MRSLVWLVPIMLLAGCAQLDDAKQAAADAQTKIDEAKREAQEAKDRLDRVTSATIIRTETVQLNVTPVGNETEVWFEVNATRAGVPIPRENLTRSVDIEVSTSAWRIVCEPLTCRVGVTGEDIIVRWANDDGPEMLRLTEGKAFCDPPRPEGSACMLRMLTEARASVLVTTAASDLTD